MMQAKDPQDSQHAQPVEVEPSLIGCGFHACSFRFEFVEKPTAEHAESAEFSLCYLRVLHDLCG